VDIELIVNSADPEPLQQLRRRTATLRDENHAVSARATFEPGDATRFAREAAERGADLVICAGGDGTLNEIVNGLLEGGVRPPAELPRLGIVPLGTANDFATFMGVPPEVEAAVSLAVEGPERVVDLARLNGRFFANVSSGGLGAAATEETSGRAKRLLGSAAYLVTGARTFAALEPSHARFTVDGEELFDGPFLFFSVGNGARSGGGNQITPRADPSDGQLDLCLVGEMSRTELLRMLPELRTGAHVNDPHVTYRRFSTLKVEPRGELSANVDGEPVGGTLLEYSVQPGALRLAARETAP
jgi:diacylglycerol kinase (ATP)